MTPENIEQPAKTEEQTPMIFVLAELAAVWIALDAGYYVLFGNTPYQNQAVRISLYYLFWLVLTVFSFREVYNKWRPVENRWPVYLTVLSGGAAIFLYLTRVLPHFAPTIWTKPWEPPSELLFATGWYFLPKSIEILIQQLIVAAGVLVFTLNKFSLRLTCIWCAVLFGGAHLFLVFGSEGWQYVSIFTASAAVASFIFPYLILRVKNGFLYSYFLHWGFYALVIVLAHLIFKV